MDGRSGQRTNSDDIGGTARRIVHRVRVVHPRASTTLILRDVFPMMMSATVTKEGMTLHVGSFILDPSSLVIPTESSSVILRMDDGALNGTRLRTSYERYDFFNSGTKLVTIQLKEFDLLKWDQQVVSELVSLRNFARRYGSRSAHMVVASKVPMLKPSEFELWRMMMEQYIQIIDYALWEVIENGATLPKTQMVEGVITVMPITSVEDKAQIRLEKSCGKIEEEVYICQPPGFEDPDFPDRVYKVEKALYGLLQAPRAWYETLSTYLLNNGFQREKINKTLFIKRHKGDIFLVQVYVDDIIFGLTKKELCNTFEKLMHEKFQMSSGNGYSRTGQK
ncbi:putative ribonuclease H-like domain-containing protein [Tanacetum coccineum]